MKKFIKNIKKAFLSVGMCYKDIINYPPPYNSEEYQLLDENKTQVHAEFLLNLEDKEEKRLESIDSKTSQLIAQTGIIFSLLGLFIPIIMDKASDFNLWIKIVLLLFLLCSFFFYLLTIHNSLKNYRINKFNYSHPSAQNVLDFMDKGIEEFRSEQVRDLLSGIKKNVYNNNRKATNLLHSYKAFKLANIMTGILVGLFSVSILFLPKEDKSVRIENAIEIIKIDSITASLKDIEKALKTLPGKDTTIVLLQDSNK